MCYHFLRNKICFEWGVKIYESEIPVHGILQATILKWANLTQMTIISTTVGKNPLEEME